MPDMRQGPSRGPSFALASWRQSVHYDVSLEMRRTLWIAITAFCVASCGDDGDESARQKDTSPETVPLGKFWEGTRIRPDDCAKEFAKWVGMEPPSDLIAMGGGRVELEGGGEGTTALCFIGAPSSCLEVIEKVYDHWMNDGLDYLGLPRKGEEWVTRGVDPEVSVTADESSGLVYLLVSDD